MIAGKSEQNFKFAEMILDESDFSFAFPIVHSESYDSQFLSLSKELVQISSAIPHNERQSLLANFAQIRVLTEVLAPPRVVGYNDTIIGHITVSFDQNRTRAISLEEMRKIIKLGEDSGQYYILTSKGNAEKNDQKNNNAEKNKGKKSGKEKSHTISLVIPDTKVHENGQTHITVSSGIHEPKCMADVALAIYNNQDTISLPVQSDPSQRVTYTINRKVVSPCKLVYLDVFGI